MMAARSPEEVHQQFAKIMNAGDVEALVALYESEAKLVPQPGQVATGKDAIRAALQSLLGLKPQIHIETRNVIQAGDLASLRSRWRLAGVGPDGRSVETVGNGTEVIRRQADGTWLLVIDNPFGAD